MQFNQQLFDYADMLAEIGAPNMVGPPLTFPKPYAAMRGLVRSAIQKDTRRGNTEAALQWGQYLLENDPVYAWSTLATVVVEDVGLANPPLLSVVSMGTLVGFRNKFVARALYAGIIIHACAGPKNRTPCEISVLVDAEGFNMGKGEIDDATLLENLGPPDSAHHDTTDRKYMYLAGVWLRKRSRHGNQELLDKSLEAIMRSYADGDKARDAMITFERPIDSMNHGVHAGLFMRGEPKLRNSTVPASPRDKVTGLPLMALDSHTELGRQALGRFATKLTDAVTKGFDGYQMSAYKLEKLIGKIVFFEEGCIVNILQETEEETTIRLTQQKAYYLKTTKDMVLTHFVKKLVRANWDVLNHYREQELKK